MAPSKFLSMQQVRSPHKSGRTAHHLTIGCSRPIRARSATISLFDLARARSTRQTS